MVRPLLLLLYTKGAVGCLKHIHVTLSRNSTCSLHGVMGVVPAGEALVLALLNDSWKACSMSSFVYSYLVASEQTDEQFDLTRSY